MESDNIFDNDEFKALLRRYEQWNEQDEGFEYFDIDDYFDLIEYYQSNDNYKAALLVTYRALKQHPLNQELMAYRISLLILCKNYDEAELLLNDLDDKETDLTFYIKGQLYLGKYNDVQRAEIYFKKWASVIFWILKKSIDLDKADGMQTPTDIDNPDYYIFAKSLYKSDSFKLNEELVSLDPKYLYEVEQNALKDDNNELDIPDSFTSLERLREAYLRIICSYLELPKDKNTDMAYRWMMRYLSHFGFSGNNYQDELFLNAIDVGDFFHLKEKILTKALNDSPYLEGGWRMLATAQLKLGKTEDALNSIEFALAINENDLDVLELKALCNYELGNYNEAAQVYEKLSEKVDDWSILKYLIHCYFSTHNNEGAEKTIDRLWEYCKDHLLHDFDTNFYSENSNKYIQLLMISSEPADYYMHIGRYEKAINVLRYLCTRYSLGYTHALQLKLLRYYDLGVEREKAKQMANEILSWCGTSLIHIIQVMDIVAMVLPHETYNAFKIAAEETLKKSNGKEKSIAKKYYINFRLASLSINIGDFQMAKHYIKKGLQMEFDYLSKRFEKLTFDDNDGDENVNTVFECLYNAYEDYSYEYKYNFRSHTFGSLS